MKIKLKTIITILLSLLTLFAGYSAISTIFQNNFCIIDTDTSTHSNCSPVQSSSYGKIWGVQVSFIGVIALIILLVFRITSTTKNKFSKTSYKIYLAGTIIGALGALGLISVQALILKIFCTSCMIIDITLIAISILSWAEKRRWSIG